jgi:hypothetical protein
MTISLRCGSDASTASRVQPVQHALAFRQAAVQGGQHHAGETGADIGFQLRRQVDFGNQDQDLSFGLARQYLGASLQIHFRFAAAGHAVQQRRFKTLRAADGIGRHLLRVVQLRHAGRLRVVHILQFCKLLDGAVERHGGQHAQVPGQARQSHFAKRALIILGGESGQRQPLRRQRRELAAHGDGVLQLFGGHIRFLQHLNDDTDHFAPPEGKHGELSRLRHIAGPAVIEHRIERRIERHSEDAGTIHRFWG